MKTITLKVGQKVLLTIEPKLKGQPAELLVPPEWECDGGIDLLEADEDNQSMWALAECAGRAEVNVSATMLLDDGTEIETEAAVLFEVHEEDPTLLNLSVGEPEPIE